MLETIVSNMSESTKKRLVLAEAKGTLAAVIQVGEDCEGLTSHHLLQLLIDTLVRGIELFDLHFPKKSVLKKTL